mgnify:CR=1 FL=1
MPIMPIPLTMDSPLQGLGERVHIARRRRRLSQGALVAQLSPRISRNSLSEIENGATVDPHASSIVALAQALGVSTDYLLGLTPEPTRAGAVHT